MCDDCILLRSELTAAQRRYDEAAERGRARYEKVMAGAEKVERELAATNEEIATLKRAFAVKVCDCSAPRTTCNFELRHEAKEFDGGMGCGTCGDAIRVVEVPELTDGGTARYFCVRELLDHLVHEQFEVGTSHMDNERLRARLDALQSEETMKACAEELDSYDEYGPPADLIVKILRKHFGRGEQG